MSRWSLPLAGLLIAGLTVGLVAQRSLHGQQQQPVLTGIPKELTSYRGVVKQVLPAVVSIESRVKPKANKKMNAPRGRRTPFEDGQVPEEFRRFFEQFGGQVPFQEMPDEGARVGFGSGFIVDPKGVVLTNHHVVADADQVDIQLADGRKFVSKDIKYDRKTDLAIVRIESKETLPFLELGDSDQMEIGDRVLAVGAPFGLTGTVTHGIISAKGRNLGMNRYEDFLQTDAAINPGNSGGPLVSLDGRVIGINSAIKSRSGGFQGVGLAIASNMVKNVMRQLLENGIVHRAYLGVSITNLNPDVANPLGVPDKHGVVVGQVFDNSPASKAGLQAGDVITSINGKTVKDAHEVTMMVASLPVGKPTAVQIVRDGKPEKLNVTVEEQPEEFGNVTASENVPRRRGSSSTVTVDKVGVEVADLTPEVAEQFGYTVKDKGALVTRVDPDGAASESGLRPRMLITKVDKNPVKSAEEFRKEVDKGSLAKGMLLQVQLPNGGTNFLMLKGAETSQK
jgi:serine protease Do